MDLLRHYCLTFLIFLPLIGVIPVSLMRGRDAVRWTALGIALGALSVLLAIVFLFDWRTPEPYAYSDQGGIVQLSARFNLIRSANIQYLVGIDGLNLPLVIVAALIFALASAAAWDQEGESKKTSAILLALESCVLGTLASLNFALMFVFMQISTILVALLLGRRSRLFLSSMVVSAILILIVLIHLGAAKTFDLVRLASLASTGGEYWFVLLLIAYAIPMAAMPLHGWLLATLDRAEIPIAMILAGIVPAIGGYGILRVAYPLFPQAARELWLLPAILGVATMIYASLGALGQRPDRSMTARATMFATGCFLLGTAMLTSASVSGAVFMLVSVVLTGAVLAMTLGDRRRADMMPIRLGFTMLAILAAIGWPGTCGFIGQIMVIIGSFGASHREATLFVLARQQGNLPHFLLETRILAVLACCAGVLMSAAMLRIGRQLFTGPPQTTENPDLNPREISILATLAAIIILLGILPILLLALTNPTLAAMMKLPR